MGRRRFWAVLLVVAVLVGLTRLTRTGLGRLGPLGSLLTEVLAPFESAASTAGRAVTTAEVSISQLSHLRSENAALGAEVEQLRRAVAQDRELRQENQRLIGLLALKDALDRRYPGAGGIGARVIARSADAWFQSLVVSGGSDDGVHPDMVVLAPAGLVGRVTAVSPHTATIVLITNPDSGVGARVQRGGSRSVGVILGQLGQPTLRMEFFEPSPSVRVGDTIVTSGLGRFYPEGLVIGTVVGTGRGDFGLTEVATVRPAVNLSRLEDVLLYAPPKAVPGIAGTAGGTP